MSFSIREVFWLFLVVAVSLGWWRDHSRQYERRLEHYAHAGAWENRMHTVRELGESSERGENITALIFMVSDPEPRISQHADLALRRIMSRPDGMTTIDYQSAESKAFAMMRWYELYLSDRSKSEKPINDGS